MSDHKKHRALPWVFHPLEFALVGFRDSGKTTLMADLVRVFSQSGGLRLGYVKHDAHQFQMDQAGKDTDRVAKAGAASVYISNDGDRAWLGFGNGPQTTPHLEFLDCDAVLIEGFKNGRLPKLCLLDSKLEILSEAALAEFPPLAYAGPWPVAPSGLPTGAVYFQRDHIDEIAAFIMAQWQASIGGRKLRGLVLTGGASSRMGRDKAQIDFHGQTQSAHMVELLKPYCTDVYVSCRSDQSDLPGRAGFPQIHDRHLGMGPLGGILSALDSHPGEAWLVCACDLPFISRKSLDHLIDRRNPWRYATAFQDAGGLAEPLCAVYEPKSRARLYQFLAMGYDCPRKMLINSRVELLGVAPGNELANVNAPAELEEAMHAIGRRG